MNFCLYDLYMAYISNQNLVDSTLATAYIIQLRLHSDKLTG